MTIFVYLPFQADLCQCKYCYKEFDTPYAMQSHLEEVHLKKGSEFVCRFRLSLCLFSYNFRHFHYYSFDNDEWKEQLNEVLIIFVYILESATKVSV